MQIREITIAELPDFAQSELWQQLHPKPITALRAVSQSMNPRAHPGDVALIIAYEGNTLAGLAGILPNTVNGQAGQRASSNTCWWVNGGEGRKLALPLFMKAFALCGQRMFMTDMTPHTMSILEKTNWFEFPAVAPGMRGFLKFNLHEVLPAKRPSLRKIKPLIRLSDQVLNLLFSPLRMINRTRFGAKDIKVETLNSLNEEMHTYIEEHSLREFIRRGSREMEWIVRYPWIKTRKEITAKDAFEYPFSHIVNHFEQYFLHISFHDKTLGLLLISVRDGHMKVPYAWFDENNAPLILQVIYRQVLQINAITLTLFRPSLVKVMYSAPHPFVFRKSIRRLVAISRKLSGLYSQYPDLQDGAGDVAFT
jgi:hypothetical protein